MASIEIKDASVSYFLRGKTAPGEVNAGSLGAQIIRGARGYLEITALKNITLSIKDGDRVGLIGVNGSGKSTLLKLCAGALSTQRGSIRIEGRLSPQFSLGAGLKSSLSGRRNTELKCLYMGTPQRQIAERVEQIKGISELGGYFELPISTYSAGMRSRLVMSMIRLVKAEILIMDEWIGVADATIGHTASNLQADLIENSSILVMASHSERVLTEWTNRLVWLERGEIREDGPTADVQPRYREWVAEQGSGLDKHQLAREQRRLRRLQRAEAAVAAEGAETTEAPTTTEAPRPIAK